MIELNEIASKTLSPQEYNKFIVTFNRIIIKLKRKSPFIEDFYLILDFLMNKRDEYTEIKKSKTFIKIIEKEICRISCLSLSFDQSHKNMTKILKYLDAIKATTTLKKIFIKYHQSVSYPLIELAEIFYNKMDFNSARYFMLQIIRRFSEITEVWIFFYNNEKKAQSDINQSNLLNYIKSSAKSFLKTNNFDCFVNSVVK